MSANDEPMPKWAVELTKQITILNERLPNHIAFTEKSVDDHEKRIRGLEQFRWILIGISAASGGLSAVLAQLIGQ